MSTRTFYVLEDGSAADPRQVTRDAAGRLRHRDGRPVAYAPHGPRTRSVDPEAERAKPMAAKPEPVAEERVAVPGGEFSRELTGDGTGEALRPIEEEPKAEAPAAPAVGREMRPEQRGKRYKTR